MITVKWFFIYLVTLNFVLSLYDSKIFEQKSDNNFYFNYSVKYCKRYIEKYTLFDSINNQFLCY
jgi:hypothetical protein